jgi:formylglycine-generating enzyme required for sulfatase activity
MANIELVERLLCERYNVASLDGLGPLSGAVQAARAGDLDALTSALDVRELYRWRAPIDAALAEASEPVAETEPVSEFDAPAYPELAGTVGEVAEWLTSIEDVETLRAISEAEAEGKNRKGVLDAIDAAIEAEEPSPEEPTS